MELIHIENPNLNNAKIIELEESAFEGAGNVDLWIIKSPYKIWYGFCCKRRG